jgi:hypothetical protein
MDRAPASADALKAGPGRARRLRLVLVIAGAALALAATQVEPEAKSLGVALAVVGAVVMAAVGVLGARETAVRVRQWTRARSVSEAIKSEVFLFLTSSGDYASGDRQERLDAEVQRLEYGTGDGADLQRFTGGIKAVERPLPPVVDVESYLQVRVRDSQLANYYEPNSKLMRRRVRQFKTLEVTLALCAGTLAAVATRAPTVGAWATVATTAAGATVAYAASERYELLWIEFSRTAAELRRLAERRTNAKGKPLSPNDLAVACEDVISVQNQAWMAKWGEEVGFAT